MTCTAVTVYDNFVWLFGGVSRSTTESLNDTYRFNLHNRQWQLVDTGGERPSPRNSHTMVTCNGNLYVFGGWSEGKFLGDLFVLHSHGSTWSEIRLNRNAIKPCGRIGHTANVFRNSIFVFGGFASPRTLGDMWEFNTATSIWSQIVASGGPSHRYRHSSVVVGELLLVFGGINSDKERFNDLYMFDLNMRRWSRIDTSSSIPQSPRSFHQAVALDGAMYVFGGASLSGKLSDTCRLVTPEFQESDMVLDVPRMDWVEIRPTPTGIEPRMSHICFAHNGDELFAFGGTNSTGDQCSDMIAVNLGTGAWRRVEMSGNIPFGVCGAKIVSHQNSIILFGGYSHGRDGDYSSTVFQFDISRSVWSVTRFEGVGLARADHSLCLIRDNLYMFGGVYRKEILGDVCKLSLDSGAVTRITNSTGPCARFGHTAVSYQDTLMVVFGGWDGARLLNDLWLYNAETNQWTSHSIQPGGPWPLPVYRHTACIAGDDMYVFGGVSDNRERLNDLWRFSVREMLWTRIETPTSPPARTFHEMVVFRSDQLVVFGGRAEEKLGDLWTISLRNGDEAFRSTETETDNEIERLRSRVTQLEAKVMCKVCMENEINAVLLPCAHRVVCLSCAAIIVNGDCICPICRNPISRLLKTIDA